MSKTFTYEVEKARHYVEKVDEYFCDCDQFDYEVEDDDLLDAVVDFVWADYYKNKSELSLTVNFEYEVKKGLKKLIRDIDSLDYLASQYEDELKEYFEDEALDYYKNR